MPDEIRRHHNDRHQDPLIGAVKTHSPGEDPRLGVPGLPLHQIRLTLFHPQRQRREAVGNEIDPQQMHRLQDGKAQKRREENTQHLAQVGRQQELDGLADVVIDPPPFLHRRNDGGEVVVGQHHIRHVFRHVRTGDAHADADVRRLDGGCVVDAVAGHGGHEAARLPRIDDPYLMLRLHAGVNAVVPDGLPELLLRNPVQLGACQRLRSVLDDSQLFCNSHSRVLVVAGDHHRPDPGFPALRHSRRHLRPHRVDHAGHADKGQVLLQRLRGAILRQLRILPVRRRQHPQGLVRHGLVPGQQLFPQRIGHPHHVPVYQRKIAPPQHYVRCAFRVLDKAAVFLMDGGHHLPHGIKGCLCRTGLFFLQGVLRQSQFRRIVDQCALGRLSRSLFPAV